MKWNQLPDFVIFPLFFVSRNALELHTHAHTTQWIRSVLLKVKLIFLHSNSFSHNFLLFPLFLSVTRDRFIHFDIVSSFLFYFYSTIWLYELQLNAPKKTLRKTEQNRAEIDQSIRTKCDYSINRERPVPKENQTVCFQSMTPEFPYDDVGWCGCCCCCYWKSVVAPIRDKWTKHTTFRSPLSLSVFSVFGVYVCVCLCVWVFVSML